MKKILFTCIAAVIIVMAFSGCGNKWVASIDGEKISVGEYECYMFFVKNTIISSGGEDTEEYWSTFEIEGKKAEDVVKETALKNAIEYTLKAQYAEKNGADRSDEAIKAQRENYINIAFDGNEEDYLTRIAEIGLTDEDFSKVIMKDYLATEYFAKTEVPPADDEEIENYFYDNYFRAKHILIDFTNYASDSTDGRGKAIVKVDEILNSISEGEDFEQLLEEYNEDPAITGNEIGYIFTSGTMPKNFEEAVKNLQPGEVSSAVETDYGYHIIKRYDMENMFEVFAQMPSVIYDEKSGRDEIIYLLEISKRNKMLSELKSDAKIKTNEKLINEISIVKNIAE